MGVGLVRSVSSLSFCLVRFLSAVTIACSLDGLTRQVGAEGDWFCLVRLKEGMKRWRVAVGVFGCVSQVWILI
jgi:hypothetical protein